MSTQRDGIRETKNFSKDCTSDNLMEGSFFFKMETLSERYHRTSLFREYSIKTNEYRQKKCFYVSLRYG